MTARDTLLAYANDWHHADCAGNFSPFAECSCGLAEWVTKAEAEATAAAGQLRERIEEWREPEPLADMERGWNRALDAVLAILDTPGSASPRQGEPVDVERLPVLMLFEGWADLLPVGTCWRIAEVRTHVEPSGVKDELGKAQSVIRFDPVPAALSEPAEAGEPE